MSRIRTLEFLPEIFKTPINSQFLGATLDQLVNPPVTRTIQGYVGSKLGYGVNAKDYYVPEYTKERTDYQLEPGVVFTKENETVARDFISYPGIINSLKNQNGITDNNSNLFESQFYSYDSFCSLDPVINFNQYYWLPEGPPAVTVAASTVYASTDYVVTYTPSAYDIKSLGAISGTDNPSLTLLRGGTYSFSVNQATQFWIQAEPGVNGTGVVPKYYLHDIYGVDNNGATNGTVTFTVPQKDAQNSDIYPGNLTVDVISTIPFSSINGAKLSELGNIDSVTSLNGRTVLFYDTGNPEAYTSSFYGETAYDTNDPAIVAPQTITVTSTDNTGNITVSDTSNLTLNNSITFNSSIGGLQTTVIYYILYIDTGAGKIKVSTQLNGSTFVTSTDSGTVTANINQGLYEEGYYSDVNDYFYTIEYVGDLLDPVLRLTPTTLIPSNQKITAINGDTYLGVNFVKPSTTNVITLLPFISAPLDTLYYQDGTNPNCVGQIKLIENNLTNTINVETDILGKTNYTSKNGVVFTNGLKVVFNGDVIPASYLEGEYYVEGVGTTAADGGGIQLVPANTLVTPEPFTTSTYYTYDSLPYDTTVYDIGLNQPNTPDYVTIARNAINKNAWSRSNRWFHVQVIEASAEYNNDPEILTAYTLPENRAKRPIIQFYPNLKLFNSGIIGKNNVDFIDFRTTDAFNYVENQQSYYPDVQTYTEYSGSINSNTTPINMPDILEYQWYQIDSLGSTSLSIWESLGAIQTIDGSFIPNTEYVITNLGTTTQGEWNTIAGTSAVVYAVGDKFTAVTAGTGVGTGTAFATIFQTIYGTAAIIAAGSLGTGTVINKSITTVSININDVNGTLQVGQWINDMILGEESQLPVETRILDIEDDGTTYTITVYWTDPATIAGWGSGVSFAISSKDNINFGLFSGARIIFASDENQSVRGKIYEVQYNYTGDESYPVITLAETPDSQLLEEDMFPVLQGYYNKGNSFYYIDSEFVQAQQKEYLNQAPLFDIFDSNGISYGNKLIYGSSTFNGTKLFAYQIGTGINDSILGFPISYSSFNNINDIRFENTLYKDEFSYVKNGSSTIGNISKGFVYNYTSRTDRTRLIGWQTAVAPSQQYQVFQFNYTATVPPVILVPGDTISYTVTCDVPQATSTSEYEWPTLNVFNNNTLLTSGTDYTVQNTDTSTIITILLTEDVDTPIEVMILSDQVSEQAYYTIPINLSNNPFNTNPEYLDLGDIRGQYQTIYANNPNFTGMMFGANNYRDLGNLVPYGTRIIQNSASLVIPGAFLRNPETNLFDALLFNSREYIKFKTMLVDSINRIANNQKYDPATLLDQAMDDLTSVKSQAQPFFWSDMLPSKSAYITNVYPFFNDQDTSIFGLSKTYDFATANYNGVLVYVQRKISGVLVTKQLLTGIDYTISTDSPTLTVTMDLIAGDKVIVKEYNATYGSYVPNTPTKLGLYPAYIPGVIYDTSYSTPTWFIRGHDGSYNKMYGDYNETLGMCVDFRDQVLLEYETRVYNNLKLSRVLPIAPAAVVPGYFRTTPLSYAEFTEVYSTNFLNWVGQNRIDYKTQNYVATDPLTYNYRGSRSALDTEKYILQGNYRGIYTYFFDTATPNTTPWEMIGYVNQPDWWETRYGPAPYTSDNLILWTDMQNGYDYNNGDPVTVELYKRPGLLNILPVDSEGNLKLPTDCVIGTYNPYTYQRNWIVGDDAPAEYSYRKSSTYPFDLMRLEALINPAMFYNLAVDLDTYKYNTEFNQFLVDGRTHLIPSEIAIYGNGTAKTSYVNWIVDYQKQLGVDATTKITTLLANLDVRLVYRLAGFSDKTMLKFFVEKGTLASPNPSLLIPDESYQVLLYNNQPSDKIVYSGVIVQLTTEGYYSVFGNNQLSAYFKVLKPVLNGKKITMTVQDVTVSVPSDYGPETSYIPYGTIYYTEQEVAQFLMSYGRFLESQGMKFAYQNNAVTFNWETITEEFLYWAQSGWSLGSVITLNPAAENITIDRESLIVQPLTFNGINFILNNNLYPIQNKDLAIFRDGTIFDVKPLNEGDALTYAQFELSNVEHGIVFNNVTLFGDVVYNLQSGLKQNRIYVRGTKSAEWNGTMFASGFIYNQDNITEWLAGVKYTQGSIVKYKNKYWTALKIVQPNQKFNQNEWKETSYNEIQKGLLPNSSTRSAESALYYNVDKANLEQDADLLSFSLIGFRPRDYMTSADLTDITQVNVYKNLIKDKGTLNAMKAFKGANLPQGGIDYDIYENWAIQQGSYGGLLNNDFIEFNLKESELTGNPGIVGLTNGNDVEGAQQLVPIYSLFNYGQPVTDPYVFPLLETLPNSLFKDAGYVNVNDVKMMAYFYTNLPAAVNKNNIIVPLSQLYVDDYVWLANYNSTWQILSPTSIGQVLQVTANLDGTSTVLFKENHTLSKLDIFAIINFDTAVNGYFIVTQVKNQKEVLINLTLPAQTRSIQGQGIALKFQSHRVAQPGDIQSLPLINNEFVKNKAWVDTDSNGNWAVYRKSINYQYSREFNQEDSLKFGYAVAYSALGNYLFSDPDNSSVYRYKYNALSDEYALFQTMTQDLSFGTAIAHKENIFAISQPTTTPSVFVYAVNDITENQGLLVLQTIVASDIDPSITKFGNALALSGDLNWLFVSDYDEDTISARNNVQVYRRANETVDETGLTTDSAYQILDPGTITNWNDISYDVITGTAGVYFKYNGTAPDGTGSFLRVDYEYVNTLTSSSTSIDKFGYSISTNYDGTQVFVGAPNRDYSATINSWGVTYVFNRLVQNIDYNAGTNPTYTLIWTPGTTPVTVYRNGIEVSNSNYTIVGNTLTYTGAFIVGDRLTVSGSQFVNSQILETEQTPRIGVGFGTSVDNNIAATDVIVGAPFALSSTNQEGAAFRYTNGGAKFGVIIGANVTNVTTTRTVLLNGYAVTITAGNATNAAAAIQAASITNVTASASSGKLIINVINQDISVINQKLVLSADLTTLTELGIDIYTQTQVILCPHETGQTQFGTVVKFNEQNSVAISAPVGTRYAQTLFDFTDDENLDNDTIFDNNSTQFIDSFPNAGAVYTYDYLENYNESLDNIGAYTYAQSVNAKNLYYGAEPRYGAAIDWNLDRIVIGAPDYRPEDIDGQVIVYVNNTGVADWSVYRYPSEVVDITKVQNMQLFSQETNNTLANLDYIDPLQNKLLGAVRQNIDVISNFDPASYNNNTVALTNPGIAWGAEHVGSIWLNTANFRFLNYNQNDNSYNARYWANVFPGSDVAAYTWVASTVEPINYTGPGTPFDVFSYTVESVLNASNVVTPIYYFWARNTNIVSTKRGKTLADSNIETYITNPLQSGISYIAPLTSNALALYNCKPFINAKDTVLHVGIINGNNDNPAHQEYTLIRQNYSEDFLPGLPGTANYTVPQSLYNKLLDSLSGNDEQGQVVPDPLLPLALQSGVLSRPRQSFFYNRYQALKNYIQFANVVMATYPIVEMRPQAINGFLIKSGTYYDTTLYWQRVNWWAKGYDNNTRSTIQVPLVADLSVLSTQNIATGTIATVIQGQNLTGETEIYRYDGEGVWTRIGITNGTIEFSSNLYDYVNADLGFSGTFYDTDVFDSYPSEETRWIVRALTEQIYTDELLTYRNKSLILIFEYIQIETIENQNYVPWLNKTSLVDVSHKIRELKPVQNYKSDNQEFLSGYINETKPYHVVIKEFLFDYTGTETYDGDITDFDLPAQFNTSIDNFVSPQLTYTEYGNAYQYPVTSGIWQTQNYKEWYNNYGLSVGQYVANGVAGQLNYPVTKLASYMTIGSTSLVVDNVQGLPINGVIKIYDLVDTTAYELIAYSNIDRENNILSGLTRGYNNTTITQHMPGNIIFMDLPPVILFSGGKGYVNPPVVKAVIPDGYPAPREEATFEVVLSLGTGSITEIKVTNPGSGYVVTPEIEIDPAATYIFSSSDVNILTNTISVYGTLLSTGDIIKYYTTAENTNIGGLDSGEWYYINVLDTSTTTLLALYQTYHDAIQDQNRIEFLTQGSGTQYVDIGARAYAIPSATPVRENNITLRFDRTSFNTQVQDWTANVFYGSEFVGYYTETASSSLKLASIHPSIYNVLASAEGTVFPVASVVNDREITWSTGPDSGLRTVAQIIDNKIKLSFTSSIDDQYPMGSTVGFTVGMPIKFTITAANIVADTIYYVDQIIDLEYFTISDAQYGATKTLINDTPSDMKCATGSITDTAVITTVYPGIREVTATSSTNNILTVPLTFANTSGTSSLYTNVPVHFTGDVFGGIEENAVYFVVSVIDSTHFTISDETPITLVVTQTTASNEVICSNVSNVAVNDAVVFNSMVINGSPVTTFGNIAEGQIYYITSIDNNAITISLTLGGSTFVTGVVSSNNDTYCSMISQQNCTVLTTDSGSMTMNIGAPVSPGQVNKQLFTFYPSLWTSPSADYYLKVDTATTFKVYSDPLCTVPVSGIDFPYPSGSWMLLPEPFYFKPSIVKYNNRVWLCTVSNNDPEFVTGKWLILDSGDAMLNALDRAKGYYAPTVNMPGYDLTQLFTGLTYPNATYKGNAFELINQYTLDTQLMDQAFAPTNINIPAIVFDGTNYLAPANTPEYSGMIADLEVADDWLLAKMANQTLALTDLIYVNDSYVMTSTNSPTPIFKSNNYSVWSTSGYYVPYGTLPADVEYDKQRLIASGLSLNAITEYDGLYIAVGDDILASDDLVYWYERLALDSTNKKFYDVSYIQSTGFTGYVAVGINGASDLIYTSTDGIEWTDNTPGIGKNCYGVIGGFDKIFVVGNDTILSSTDGINYTEILTGTGILNAIVYADNTLVAVGDAGKVYVSIDGTTWTLKATSTIENLNSVMYTVDRNEWIIVGDNNTIIQTANITASPVVWDTTQLFRLPDPEYTIQGDAFTMGYGPEELVPGIVTDTLTMIVNTRPGTNWPATEYEHVGYNVVSVELDNSAENAYSFRNVVQTPSTISVFAVNNGLSVTLYETLDYIVNWSDKTVTLTNNTPEQIRIDVYETGNGDQLVESSTDENPVNLNESTGFQEIQLNCNYVGLSYMGGGIVYPGTEPIAALATVTDGTYNTIVVTNINEFTLNGEIYFSGAVFGGVAVDTPYYVKSINAERNTITISSTIGGTTYTLTSDTGAMSVIIQRGPGDLFTEPGMFYNGTLLTSGHTNYVVATNSTTNAITTFTTNTLVADQKITFSDAMFGGVSAQTTYYIKNILSTTEFTISDTVGGTEVPLTSATGLAIFVTEDYAVAQADNQVSAKVILADHYDTAVDYIAYTFYTQTDPQYGYTLPQIEIFNGDGTVGPYTLTSYLGGTNPENAVVEVNGLRVSPNDYSISFAFQKLQFTSMAPSISDTIAVTTYNDTQRQYFYTTAYDTNKQVTAIVNATNNITLTEPTVIITTDVAHNLSTNDVVRIDGVLGSTQLNGKLFIVEVINTIQVRIYYYTHGVIYSDATPVTDIHAYSSGGYIWKYQTWMLENTYATQNDTTYLTVDSTKGLVVDTPVYFTEDGSNDIGYPLTSIPELVAGQKYFIAEVDEFTLAISVSETQGGAAMTLTANAGPYNVRVTQWEQTNVDRLWVTVNGERVASSNLRLNEANEVGILTDIAVGDEVVITSMMPTATPNSETYIQIVDQDNVGAVYRANPETTTWTTDVMNELSTTMIVYDLESITYTEEQEYTATPDPVTGIYSVGLAANKNEILSVTVYNNTKSITIQPLYYSVEVSGLGPVLNIVPGTYIDTGDSLTITTTMGSLLYVNGEYMTILDVDNVNNEINVLRGALGSPVLPLIPKNSKVYSLIDKNRMSDSNYATTWNPIPGVYNADLGDPLQIAVSSGAEFLRRVVR